MSTALDVTLFTYGDRDSLSREALAKILGDAHRQAAAEHPDDRRARQTFELAYIRASLGWDAAQQGWRHVGENKPGVRNGSPGGCPTLSE
ncbi:hypothetical protein [Nocardia sp. NPDC060259]|uniref:hypothetical protein n=1 Tax=Nocardia sp. NPDC060259 TaxID=3347088 RepID=UPI0036685C0E